MTGYLRHSLQHALAAHVVESADCIELQDSHLWEVVEEHIQSVAQMLYASLLPHGELDITSEVPEQLRIKLTERRSC